MPTTGIYEGKNVRMYVDSNLIGYARNVNMSISGETEELTHKDTSGSGVWTSVSVTKLTGTVSGEAYYSEDTTVNSGTRESGVDIFDFMVARTEVTCKIDSAVVGDTRYDFTGYFTQLDQSHDNEGRSTFTYTLAVNGSIAKATNT